MARRACRRATQHRICWRQREPPCLAFCPSDLPVKISEVLGTSQQHDSSPKRSPDLAQRRHVSFCREAAARQPQERNGARHRVRTRPLAAVGSDACLCGAERQLERRSVVPVPLAAKVSFESASNRHFVSLFRSLFADHVVIELAWELRFSQTTRYAHASSTNGGCGLVVAGRQLLHR